MRLKEYSRLQISDSSEFSLSNPVSDERYELYDKARQLANENWVRNIRRDVFLDDDRDPEKIKRQFDRLIEIAQRNGIALGIGHPYPETVKLLEKELPKLKKYGVEVVPVSELLERHMQEFRTWRAFLAPTF